MLILYLKFIGCENCPAAVFMHPLHSFLYHHSYITILVSPFLYHHSFSFLFQYYLMPKSNKRFNANLSQWITSMMKIAVMQCNLCYAHFIRNEYFIHETVGMRILTVLSFEIDVSFDSFEIDVSFDSFD